MNNPTTSLQAVGRACDRLLHQCRTGTPVFILRRTVALVTSTSRDVEDALSDLPDCAIVRFDAGLDPEQAWLIDHPQVDITKFTVPDDLSEIEPRPLTDSEVRQLDLQVLRDIAAHHDLTIAVTDRAGRSLL